ncbi:hypothetical protein [Brevibacillus laterosporus]|uniref:hypothetical protein n=1 Tax=Brevibacillus laterosporus TaxID=1465 RepID=UPI0018CEC665|nr:hypothetical protein [Brevibacillus laterosporus]MBG9797693.1 hypothetical protein [Brevibacillus laterosporus]MED1909637.1 hypothetical protein [Brevibacillus laterosporus]
MSGFISVTSEVKQEFSQNLVPTKPSIAFAVLGSIVTSILGINAGIMILIMFLVAFVDGVVMMLFKKARDPKVKESEYYPISRLMVFLGLMLLFIGCSLVQIAIEFLVWKSQGHSLDELLGAEWAIRIKKMINAQTLGLLGIIWYYFKRFKGAFTRLTGEEVLPEKGESA